jgi:general secretion pathway protein G
MQGEANMAGKRDRRDRRAGFTIVELLVVMVILGLQAEKAREKTAQVQIRNLSVALDALALDTGRYPSGGDGLRALLDKPGDMDMWDGPYVKSLPKDPWGKEYQYEGPSGDDSGTYNIVSLGPDGRPSGDDIKLNKD